MGITPSASDRERALATNAFGDHFLTDAFASGHLINKQDLMDHFAAQLAGNEDAFFQAVATGAWADTGLATFVSGFETTDVFGWNISSAGPFQNLLEGVHDERPDVIQNAVVKIVHDLLNKDGVEVSNSLGDSWKMTGDESLNEISLKVGKKAVAQSQQNVLSAVGSKQKPDYNKLFEAVWAYVPRPTKDGAKSIENAVQDLANPSEQATIDSLVDLLIENIEDIIDQIVAEGQLAPAGRW